MSRPMIRLSQYPQLKLLAWSYQGLDEIEEVEALALYERGWPYVDQDAMSQDEKELLARLVQTYGNGCFAHV